MYLLYQLIISLLFYLALPLLLAVVLIGGVHRQGLSQRLGLYRALPTVKKGPRLWLHAASVGEVGALQVLIGELRRRLPDAEFVVTTMTIHGREAARRSLGEDVICLLAPLDIPGIVDRVLSAIDADVYVCVETELWPVLLAKAARRGLGVVLVNGRMSLKSAQKYLKRAWFFREVLANFDHLALISAADQDRYAQLGVSTERMTVLGNLKYDRAIPPEADQRCQAFRELLAIDAGEPVFICGSTHSGEEELLLPVALHLLAGGSGLWIVAPRHLQRLPEVTALFQRHQLGFQLLSALQQGEPRREQTIILDSFGDLPVLYGLATFIFCGGSLTARNGHNIMEAALWRKAVFYGPSMADFQDAVDLLEAGEAGFAIGSAAELLAKIEFFQDNPDLFTAACDRAGAIARRQQGAAARQAAIVIDCLPCGRS